MLSRTCLLALLLAILAPLGAASAEGNAKPNIVLIFIDDK